MKYLETRKTMCEIGRRIQQNGFVVANDGNISVKLNEYEYLTSPTGVSKGYMEPEMIVLVNEKGTAIEDNSYNPSSEIKVHLQVYKNRPDVNSVIHTHPQYATIFAILNEPLDMYILPETVFNVGCVPIVPYAQPSSVQLADNIVPYLDDYDAFLLENHGLITIGPDILSAYFKTETVEFFAATVYKLKQIGCSREMTKPQIDGILDARRQSNVVGRHPGYKKLS